MLKPETFQRVRGRLWWIPAGTVCEELCSVLGKLNADADRVEVTPREWRVLDNLRSHPDFTEIP